MTYTLIYPDPITGADREIQADDLDDLQAVLEDLDHDH